MYLPKSIRPTLAKVVSDRTVRITSKKWVLMSLTFLLVAAGPSQAYAKPDWAKIGKVVLADAGGAASGFSLGGPVGAIAGGCTASSAACGILRPGAGTDDEAVTSNPKNSLDWVGKVHNQLVTDYFKDNKSYDSKSFYQFAEKNKKRYRIDKMPSMEQMTKAAESAGDEAATVEERWNVIDKQFKTAGIKQDIVGRLRPLFPPKVPGPTFPEWEASVLQIENEVLLSKDLTTRQLEQLSVFFSVLRHSAALWHDNEPARK